MIQRPPISNRTDTPLPNTALFRSSIAAPRLVIIVALRGPPAQYLDLAVVDPEAFVAARNLRFGGAFIGQENACRAAFDDRRRDARAFYVGNAMRGEDHARILLSERFQPFAQLRRDSGAAEDTHPTAEADPGRGSGDQLGRERRGEWGSQD